MTARNEGDAGLNIVAKIKGHILVTRPEIDAVEIANVLRAKNYDVTSSAFLKISFLKKPLDDLNFYSGLVFTSVNGVRAFCHNSDLRDLPVWSVGEHTSQAAKEAGFQNITTAGGNVAYLTQMLMEHASNKPYLYIRGAHISKPIRDVRLEEVVLYESEKIIEIPFELKKLICAGNLTHVVFFSKRTAQSFIEAIEASQYAPLLKEGLKTTMALCLGDSMVECLSVLPWQDIKIAKNANRDSLIAILN